MRRKLAFILLGILCVTGAGCGDGARPAAPSDVDIPETIHILYDVEKITAPEEACVYSVDYIQMDLDILRKHFLRYQAAEEGVDAFGRYVYTQTEEGELAEVLYAYDGGEEAGIYSGVDGGFSYSVVSADGHNYDDIVCMQPEHPDNVDQMYGYRSMTDFAQWEDLRFMSLDEASREAEELMTACGIPKLQLDTVYALDAPALEKHARILAEHGEDAVDWQTEDEAYLFLYKQSIDGIPVIDHAWNEGTISGQDTLYCYAYVLLSDNGILDAEMRKCVETKDKEAALPLLSPQEAEKILLREYGKTLQIAETYVESLELDYIGLTDGEAWKLVPAWVFCVFTEHDSEDAYSGESVTVRTYEHYVINAVTGEHILTAGGNES